VQGGKAFIVLLVDPSLFCRDIIFRGLLFDQCIISLEQKLSELIIVAVGCHMKQRTIFTVHDSLKFVYKILNQRFRSLIIGGLYCLENRI